METFGRHLLVEMSGCNPARLGDGWFIKGNMEQAALKSGATILASKFHHFEPTGISGVVIIAESHLSIHTWPERGYAALDFYTCGNIDPRVATDMMSKVLEAKATHVVTVQRGLLDSHVLVSVQPGLSDGDKVVLEKFTSGIDVKDEFHATA